MRLYPGNLTHQGLLLVVHKHPSVRHVTGSYRQNAVIFYDHLVLYSSYRWQCNLNRHGLQPTDDGLALRFLFDSSEDLDSV